MGSLRVRVVSPERRVFDGEAAMVVARTTDGELGIMPGMQPTLGALVSAPVKIERSGEPDWVAAVHGGVLSVSEEGVTILAEVIELPGDIDVPAAREALANAEGLDQLDPDVREAVRRATTRLSVAGAGS